MALSNTLKEPRRELTETGIGVVVIATAVGADYAFASWFANVLSPPNSLPTGLGVFLGMMVGALLVIVTWGLLLFAHFLGEVICDSLANNGIYVRPKRRW